MDSFFPLPCLLVDPRHWIFIQVIYVLRTLMMLIFISNQADSSSSSPLVSTSSNSSTCSFKMSQFLARVACCFRKSYFFVLNMACGGMIFIEKFSNFRKKNFHFILFHLIFFCYHCSINLKRPSEYSGLRPDTSSLVVV